MTIRPVGPELFHLYGRTDAKKRIVACRNFANKPEIEWELTIRVNTAQSFQRTITVCQHTRNLRTSWRISPISAHSTVIRYCRFDVRGSVHHSTIHKEKSNKDATATMYQTIIIPYLYGAQHVSGDTPPIIRSLKLHWQPLIFHMWKVVRRVVGGRCQAHTICTGCST